MRCRPIAFDDRRPIEARRRSIATRRAFALKRAGRASRRRWPWPATGAVARGDRGLGDQSMAHPVGTGPFRLAHWRRGSRVVLERNLRYRECATTPSRRPTMPRGRRSWRGSRSPAADGRPGGGVDHRREPAQLAGLPQTPRPTAAALRVHRRGYARRAAWRLIWPVAASVPSGGDAHHLLHHVQHGASGWWAAMRRHRWRCAAPSAWPSTCRSEIAYLRHGAGVPAQPPITPNMSGYDPAYRSTMSESSIRCAPGRCWMCTAGSTAMATAGASGPTDRRCCWRWAPSRRRTRGAMTSHS